jgi:hypothetical protein
MIQSLNPISVSVLEQLHDLVKHLSPEDYSRRLTVFNGSSIGGHVRHVIEFYECLLHGIDRGTVNYDARLRDHQVEQNRDYALEIIKRSITKLKNVETYAYPLTLVARFASADYSIPSNFAREEAYLIEHSIHHFALIRIGVQTVCPSVQIDPNFGVAYSTVEHRNQTA